MIFKLRQTCNVFETSTSHTKSQMLGEATCHDLTTVERVGTDICVLGDTVKALTRVLHVIIVNGRVFIRLASD